MEKVVLITGASSGIGKETAKYFAAQNWKVIATMRSPEKETELTGFENIAVLRLDVEFPDSIKTAINTGIEKFGKIDVLINNAGYGQQGLFEGVSDELIRKQFDVNVFGPMNVIKGVLPVFRKQQSGTIINITSGAGRVTVPMWSVYHASKFAVEGFTEALSFELASQNIKTKIVAPGAIATNFLETSILSDENSNAPSTYSDYKQKLDEKLNGLITGNPAAAIDVAKLIYQAATDGTDTFRYLIGEDIKPLIEFRNSNTDQDYINFMRQIFTPEGVNY